MDLDEDELKATRKLNGADSKKAINADEEIKKIQEEANKSIQEIVDKINTACEGLADVDFLQHVIIVGYVDVGAARGFVSSNYNLKHMESQSTFLLDYLSKNIKESVKAKARQNTENIKDIINKEKGDNKDD